jgi:uncharacterized membrane protein
MTDKDESIHWLVRPATIRKLWYVFSVVLAVVVVAQAVIPVKGYFGVDGWFGFGAVYGFVSCLLMVLVAKVLGVILKRPQGYFRDTADTQDPGKLDSKAKENSDAA